MKRIIYLYKIKQKKYKLSDNDETPVGSVEPCAGTDTDEPSCGIAILDTDGEWIEMKNKNNISAQRKFTLLKQAKRTHVKNNSFVRLR